MAWWIVSLSVSIAVIAALLAGMRETLDRLNAESWKRRCDELKGELMIAKAKGQAASRQYHELLRDLATAKPIKPFTGRKKR